MKNQKGVTLIALVVTIVVLLILAGVAIAMLRGDNGILTEATKASDSTAISEEKEAVSNAINELTTQYYDLKYVETNTTLTSAIKGKTQGQYIADNLNSKVSSKVDISKDESTGNLTIKTKTGYTSGTDKGKVEQATYTAETGTLSDWTKVTKE